MDIKTAILFAAGYGKRLQPITNDTPKPLVKVNNKPIIKYGLDHLKNSGISKVIINTHHLYQKVENFVDNNQSKNQELIISREIPTILETAGGIIKAIDNFENKPFISYNGDVILVDKNNESLNSLINQFNPKTMDMLLLLQPTNKSIGYNGKGDFSIDTNNQISKEQINNYVFTGIQIINPTIFKNKQPAPESLSSYFKKAFNKETKKLSRVYGLVHQGDWLHIGDLEGLKSANEYFNNN